MNAREARAVTEEAKEAIRRLQTEEDKAYKTLQYQLHRKRVEMAISDILPQIKEKIKHQAEKGFVIATYSFEQVVEPEVIRVLRESLDMEGYDVAADPGGAWIQAAW